MFSSQLISVWVQSSSTGITVWTKYVLSSLNPLKRDSYVEQELIGGGFLKVFRGQKPVRGVLSHPESWCHIPITPMRRGLWFRSSGRNEKWSWPMDLLNKSEKKKSVSYPSSRLFIILTFWHFHFQFFQRSGQKEWVCSRSKYLLLSCNREKNILHW